MRRQRIIKILRKFSAFIALLPLIFSFVLSYFQVAPKDAGERFSFNENGEFSILVIGGLLEGEKGFSEQGKGYLKRAIDIAKPNLVILSGNNIRPQPIITDLFLAETMKIIDEYNAVFNEKQVYFSVMFGVWDNESLYDKSAQLKRYMRSDYFVGGIADRENLKVLYSRRNELVGNFRINIYDNDNVKALIYIIDNQGNGNKEDQQNWLERTSNKSAYIFSNGKNYSFDSSGGTFDFVSETTNAVFSSFNFDDYEFYVGDIFYGTLPQSGKFEEGDVEYDYTAKKIVLTVAGGLYILDV